MPSALSIRKKLLDALEDELLPGVQSGALFPLLLAEMPMRLPPEVKVKHLAMPPLPDADDALAWELGRNWPQVGLNNYHLPHLIFLLDGEVDLRLGTTRSMADATNVQNQWTQSGCHVLRLHAPTLLFVPPGVPYSDEASAHWEGAAPIPDSKILWLHLTNEGARCHLCSTINGTHQSIYPLLVADGEMEAVVRLLSDELRERRDPESPSPAARHCIAVLLLRLHRHIESREAVVANTAWLPSPVVNEAAQDSPRHHIVHRVDQYVQLHLSEPITLTQIAAHCELSPTHLNRLFNAAIGLSVKRYVNQRRIEAASAILRHHDWPIKEVAGLVGFSQLSHFCQVFQRVQGKSPGQYRRDVQQK